MRRDTESILRSIGRRIAEIRTKNGFTQEAFAEHAEITVQYLQRLEAGKQNFSIATLNRLAEYLGVPFEDLLMPPQKLESRPGRPRKG